MYAFCQLFFENPLTSTHIADKIKSQVSESRTKENMEVKIRMYPNLLGQKAYHHLSNDDMAGILNISRTAIESKLKSGRFTPQECKILCRYFDKPFAYLFATDDEISGLES